jgi:hypothetical protein
MRILGSTKGAIRQREFEFATNSNAANRESRATRISNCAGCLLQAFHAGEILKRAQVRAGKHDVQARPRQP